jgi:hypothetical protein
MITDDFVVQSLPVALRCDAALYPELKDFFDSLWKDTGESTQEPLKMEVTVQSSPPQLPSGASVIVETPLTKCLRDGQHHYYSAKDGSIVRFDPKVRYCQGFIRPGIQHETSTICSLVSGPLIETMKSAGRFYLHAAALAHNGIGYLISGDGGCGKTTSALNLVRSGFDYVSDDSLLLDHRDGVVRAYPWSLDFHVSPGICGRYDELQHLSAALAAGEKCSVDVSRYFKGVPKKWIEPNVIIFPRICSRKTSILSPIDSMEVFTRLMRQTILGSDPVLAKRHLELIKVLVQKAQGFELLGGADLLEDPEKLSTLITSIPNRQ